MATVCPRYQDDPVDERNQIIDPTETSKLVQTATDFLLPTLWASIKYEREIAAPTKCARYSWWNAFAKSSLKGIAKSAGIGG